MKTTLNRIGAFVCVAAFLVGLASSAVLGMAAGPRNPGADVYVLPEGVIFKIGGSGGTPVPKAIQGDEVTVNLTIYNAGDMDSTKVNITVTLETNAVVFMVNLTKPVPAAPGRAYYETVWNTTFVPIGPHTVNVTVTELQSGDDNLNNNTAYVSFDIMEVPVPRVYIESLTLNYTALVGDIVPITATLKNNGSKDMNEDDFVKFYVGTAPLPGGLIQYSPPNLPKDNYTSVPVTYNWDTTSYQAGPFFITAEVMSSHFKLESSHPINLSFPAPNVYVNSISVDKNSILQGESIIVTAKLRNNGTMNALDEEIWFLVDEATSPTLVNYTIYRNIPKGNLDFTITFTWNSTDAPAGNHTFKVRVPGSSDPKASLVSPAVVVIPKTPKMAMTSFTATPGQVNSGETITLSAELENTGSADAYNQEVRFYLTSVDTYPLAIKKVNVRTGSSVRVNATFVPEIGANNTDMTFFASFEQTVLSKSVSVNSTVPKLPDLTVASVEAERNMTIKSEYTISAVVANIGKKIAQNFMVKFNLGTELPYIVKGLDLGVGESFTVNWTFVPTIVGSGLRLKVEVNANSSVDESDRFNNIFEEIRDISVRPEPKPFIEVTKLQPEKNQRSFEVNKGDTAQLTLEVTLQNKGEKEGMVLVTIREGLVTVVSENVTVPAKDTKTFPFRWNISGPRTHTAKVEISGADVGLIVSQITSVDLTEKTPGFELVALIAAVALVAILVRRRKK